MKRVRQRLGGVSVDEEDEPVENEGSETEMKHEESTSGEEDFGEMTVVKEVSSQKAKQSNLGQADFGTDMKSDEKRVIEAALFISSKPLTAIELGKFVGIAAPGFIDAKIKELVEDYEKAGSALTITKETAGYIMRAKPEYASRVAPLAKEAEISKGALKVLAFISKNEGIKQSDAVKKLGSGIYEHVKELVGKDFVEKTRNGRTSTLKTTQKFREYFQA